MRALAILTLTVMPAWALADDDHGEEHHAEDEMHAEEDHDAHEGEDHAEAAHDDHDDHDDAAGHAHDDDDGDSHLAEMDGLRILHGWARASEGPEAQVFMEIENTRDGDVVLTGAHADWAGAVRMVGASIQAGGEPLMLEEMEVAAGTTFDLTPDTVYFLLDGIAAPLEEGDEVTMEVEFAGIGHVDIAVQVEAADARQHSHAGHAH